MLNDEPYTVVVDPDATVDGPDDLDPTHVGAVTGSTHVVTLLRAMEGERVAATPTGPFYDLDTSNPESVLAALHGLTNITAVNGEAPQVIPPAIVGAEY